MNNNENPNTKKDITLNSAGLSLFNGDNYFYHIFKKTQKILSATYLITDFISDNDPIKLAIRDSGLALYKSAAEMSISASPNRKGVLDKFFSCGLSLVSYCQVASQAGLMSVMNFEIMSEEIRMLMQTVEEREVPHKLGRNFVISKDVLQTEQMPHTSHQTGHHSGLSDQRDHPAHAGSSAPRAQEKRQEKQPSRMYTSVYRSPNAIQNSSQNSSQNSQNSSEKDNSRRQKIVDLIKMKGEVSIKDISDNFFDCSEKTIQRELIALVEEGVLAKAGERRWSRYSISK